MKKVDITFKELLERSGKLTFLVGAGCSADPPSNLPLGREMIGAIIKHACAKSEVDKILAIENLRFEQVVEIIRNQLDPELKLIDYYGECESPNLQHFFLADMLKKGHLVVTTNFDFLIERALLASGIPKEQIIPVITEDDYKNPEYQDPEALFEKGKMAVYKIHGSTKNIITGEDTRKFLMATIKAFGSGKEGENIFQLQNFKRPTFEALTNGRTLVLLGYSGSDDFDVVPTLMILKHLENIIWINHNSDDEGIEKLYEINDSMFQETNNIEKSNEILADIFRMNNTDRIFKADLNTTRLMETMLAGKPNLNSTEFNNPLTSWFNQNIAHPNECSKLFNACAIYEEFGMLDEILDCSERMAEIAQKNGDLKWQIIALTKIGEVFFHRGKLDDALDRLEKALIDTGEIRESWQLYWEAIPLLNIGKIFSIRHDFVQALEYFRDALVILEQLDEEMGATTIMDIAQMEDYHIDNDARIIYFIKALKIAEEGGYLRLKARAIIGINEIFIYHPELRDQYEYGLGERSFENDIKEALEIGKQLCDLEIKASCHRQMGNFSNKSNALEDALRHYKKALTYDKQLNSPKDIGRDLSDIGHVLSRKGEYKGALKYYQESLVVFERIDAPEVEDIKISILVSKKEISLNNIINIASTHYKQGNYPKALKSYEEALSFIEQLKEHFSEMITCLDSIASIHYKNGNYPEALKRYEEALEILNRMGLGNSPNARTIKKKINTIKKKMQK